MMARVYRTAMWRLHNRQPFWFYSLTLPDRGFSFEEGLLALAKSDPRVHEPGHASRFAYPLDFVGPLPRLVAS